MKIGIFDPYLDDLGGGEKYMMTIAQILSKNNIVTLFWDHPDDLIPLTERFALDLSRVKTEKNIFSSNISFTKRLLESRKYDAIIILSDGSIPLLASKKLFVHIQQPLRQFEKGTLKNMIKLSRVTKFFCNSEYTKSFISNSFGLKTEILYPPVDLKPKNLKKENIVLHVGRFRVKNVGVDDYKKQRVMVGSFKEMVDKGLKNWKFVLAVSVKKEDEKEFNKLKESVKKYPIEFLINKSNDELWDIYSKSKIYWHASGYGEDLEKFPEYAEHFGISTVEAMGAGCVPVVINAGGQKEIVENNVNGLTWDNLDELKLHTIKLIEDEKLLLKLSDEARKTSHKYNMVNFEKKLLEIIK